MIFLQSHINESDEVTMKVLRNNAMTRDIDFFRDLLCTERCPEYNGYNTKYLRDINMLEIDF